MYARGRARHLLAAAVVATGLALLLLVVVTGRGRGPTPVDQWVYDFTGDWTSQAPWTTDVAAVIAVAAGGLGATVVAVGAVGFLVVRRRLAAAAFVALSAALGVVVIELVKRSVGRPRPPGAEEFVSDLDKSFPSGHAAAGIYVFAALAVLVLLLGASVDSRATSWVGLGFFALSIGIGLSRVVLGVHWATDVMAGWAVGSAVLLGCAAVARPGDSFSSETGPARGGRRV